MLITKSAPNIVWLCVMKCRRKHTLCQGGLVDNAKSRVLLYLRDSRDLREKRDGSDTSASRVAPVAHDLLVSLIIHGGFYGYDGTCGAGRDSDLDRA